MRVFFDWLQPANFMPHGHCYLWRPDVLWLHVGSDTLIALSYYAIPVALAYFVSRRRAVLPYWWVPALFAMFIFLCGTTHVMNIWTVWNPDYVADGLVKLATGIASAATAILVFATLPQALELRTPIELQREVDGQTAQLLAVNARLQDEIAARIRTETAFRDSEARFRATFENAAVGIAHVAPDGRWLDVNAVFCGITGYCHDELLGCTFSDITHPADLEKDWMEARRLLDGEIGSYTLEKRYLRKDGGIVWVMLTVSLIRQADGRPHYFISVIDDITDRKQTEEALLERELRERLALQKLAEADQRKNQFLATLAHELRNPLAPISNGLQVMQMSVGTDLTLKPVTLMMERQMKHLVRLVDDLLDISRITRGKVSLRTERLSLQPLLKGAIEMSWTPTEAERLELIVEMAEVSVDVEGDRDRLTQVFSNILSNAAKYTNGPGKVWLSLRREGRQAVVRIQDTGVGIPPEALEHVFEMFSQLSPAGLAERGLGIGLALVRELVELHLGQVEARSEGPDRGSEFIVRLPALEPNAAIEGSPAQSAGTAAAFRRRVLVVDDNLDAAEALKHVLLLLGHEVHQSADGATAVDVVRHFEPDVVFMDIGMPGMNGLEAARRIRRLTLARQPLICALTGWGQEADRVSSQAAGIDRHLVKPIDRDTLQSVLAQMSA
jgi:PAS domain S-box-containing protein